MARGWRWKAWPRARACRQAHRIVEDVTTTGGSALKAVEAVRDAGGEIVLVFTMVDREEGATKPLREPALSFARSTRPVSFLKDLAALSSPSAPALAKRGEQGSRHPHFFFTHLGACTARLPSRIMVNRN